MSIQELVKQGWADHADKTAEVADRLEAGLELVEDAQGAIGFMGLVNHAIGDHLGDRERALRINEAAYAKVQSDENRDPLVYLAAARHLAGQSAEAAEAESALGGDPGIRVRINMLVAQGRMHGGDWEVADMLYRATLEESRALDDGHAGERATAIVSNGIAGEAMGLKTRSPVQNELMEAAALGAREFWTKVGTWVNAERAEHTLACVRNLIGKHAEALAHADQGLALIKENGEEAVDEAFLNLARATALRGLERTEEHGAAIARAKEIAAGFDADWIKSWFAEELAKAE